MLGLYLSPTVIPKPIGQVQQFPGDFPHYIEVSFKSQEEMIRFAWGVPAEAEPCHSSQKCVRHHQYLLHLLSQVTGFLWSALSLVCRSTSPHSLLTCVDKKQSLGAWWPVTHCWLSCRASQAWVFPRGPALPAIRCCPLAAQETCPFCFPTQPTRT